MDGRRIQRRAALIVALAVLSGLSLTTPAGAAAPAGQAPSAHAAQWRANQCSGPRDIRVHHNAAGLRYIECHRGSGRHRESSVALWLWDNKTDGKCAQAYVRIGRWQHWWSWCSTRHHSPRLISGWHPGGDAKVSLSLA